MKCLNMKESTPPYFTLFFPLLFFFKLGMKPGGAGLAEKAEHEQ